MDKPCQVRGLLWIPGLVALLLSQAVHVEATIDPAPKPDQLIQIGVEVVEVDEDKSQQLGLEWINSLGVAESDVPALLTLGALTRDKLFVTLHALLENGAADILANPKLVTQDGTTANFHAGGELPYASTGGLGSVNVEFKAYGVNLKIKPHVEKTGRIAMNVDVEVSAPDNQYSVTLSGNKVPGLRSRTVSSQLTLDAGSTLTMAGLLQKNKEVHHTGVPLLMSIPLLGRLFRYDVEMQSKTSIAIFITPSILKEGDTYAKAS